MNHADAVRVDRSASMGTDVATKQTESPITENFSEKRPKRGRPTVDDGLIDRCQLGSNAHTRHGKLNWWYLTIAICALKEAPDHNTRWPWLVPNGFDLSKVRFPRHTVLAELGRIDDAETIREIADLLCDGTYTAVEVSETDSRLATRTADLAQGIGLRAIESRVQAPDRLCRDTY